MKRIFVTLSVVAILLNSCVSFEKISLSDDNQSDSTGLVIDVKKLTASKPALTFNQGKLDYDLVSASSAGTVVSKKGEYVMSIEGGKDVAFTQDVPALDFRGDLAIKLKAKAESDVAPYLQLLLEDENGFVTNGQKLGATISKGDAFNTYYFDLKGAYSQSYPEVQDVNGKRIVKVNFRINGKFTGKVLLKDVKVILSSEIIKQKKNVPVGKEVTTIADFNNGIEGWIPSKRLIVTAKEGGLELQGEEIGPLYENVTTNFDVITLSSKKKVKIKVKVEGDAAIDLRFDLIDVNGIITNKRPLIKKVNAGDWQEVIFDFENRLLQSYPQQVDLDISRIAGAVIYVNPGRIGFTGKVLIDTIDLVE